MFKILLVSLMMITKNMTKRQLIGDHQFLQEEMGFSLYDATASSVVRMLRAKAKCSQRIFWGERLMRWFVL